MSDVRCFTTNIVTPLQSGPLFVTVLTETHLIIVDVPFNAHNVAARLHQGPGVKEVLDRLNSLQKAETNIPVERLQSVRWIDGREQTEIVWLDDHGRTRRKMTEISHPAQRTRLLELLATQVGHHPRETEEPAGVWELAWSQLLGAILSIVLTAVFVIFWDPKLIAGARGGRIALWLGPTGCALVGAVIFVVCLVEARRRLSPRPMKHSWTL